MQQLWKLFKVIILDIIIYSEKENIIESLEKEIEGLKQVYSDSLD